MNRFIFNLSVFNIFFFSVLEVESASKRLAAVRICRAPYCVESEERPFNSNDMYHVGKGNCVLKDQRNRTLNYVHWKNGIELNPVNDFEEPYIAISRLFYENITDVTKPNWNEQFNYFFAYTDFTVNAFVIKTDYQFRKYEEKENSTDSLFTVEFQCQNGERSEIAFKIPINDTNNHSPEFLNEPYEYTVPMPIPKGYRLDLSGRIAVRDIDLTNKYVTFDLDQNSKHADAFIVSSTGPDANNVKIYPAQFVASTAINLEDDVTYTLFATDSGNPPRTANTSIKIIVDKANSFPRFTHSLYTSNLTEISKFTKQEINKSIQLSFVEGNIIIDRGYQGLEHVEIKNVFNANKNDFKLTKVKLDNNNIATHIELVNVTEEFLQQKIVTLILTATKDMAVATTVVQLLLPGLSKLEFPVNEMPCAEHASVQVIIAEYSNYGYIAAIVMTSLLSIGLSGYIVYFLFYRQANK